MPRLWWGQSTLKGASDSVGLPEAAKKGLCRQKINANADYMLKYIMGVTRFERRVSLYVQSSIHGEFSRTVLVERHIKRQYEKLSTLFLSVAPASVSKACSLHQETEQA